MENAEQLLVRTVTLKLDIPLDVVQKTIAEWLAVCNYISRVAFEHGCLSGAQKLHKLTYAAVRARFKLSSQMTCNAIREVAAKYAGSKTHGHRLKRPIKFTRQALNLQYNYDFRYAADGLSLWTLDGRLKGIGYQAGAYFERYQDWELGGGKLYIRRGEVYLAQSVKQAAPSRTRDENDAPTPTPDANVIGVDKGINVVAAVTDGRSMVFFGGGRVRQTRRRYQKLHATLQRKKAQQPTRSVTRLLQRLRGREARFIAQTNHTVSKRIIAFAQAKGCATLAVEDLSALHAKANTLGKPMRTLVNRWAFGHLDECLRYKAAQVGIQVVVVDPRYTSRACSRCGYTDKANRRKHQFHCRECGYRAHADGNAARNIRQRGIAMQ